MTFICDRLVRPSGVRVSLRIVRRWYTRAPTRAYGPFGGWLAPCGGSLAWVARGHRGPIGEGRTTSDPYAFLDPAPDPERDGRPLVREPSASVAILRALRKRCPRCGQR